MKKFICNLLNKHIWISPVSVLENLLRKNSYMIKERRVLFLDIDGVIWEDKGPGTILRNPKINAAAQVAVKEAKNRHFKVVLITNQTYFCYQSRIRIKTLLHYVWSMTTVMLRFRVIALLVCHHHPNANFEPLKRNCHMRKPSPGMLKKLRIIFPYDLDNSILIGDRITDIACASLGGIAKRFLIQNSCMLKNNVNTSTNFPQSLTFSVIPMTQSKWHIFE